MSLSYQPFYWRFFMKKAVALFCIGIAAVMISCGDKSPTGGGGGPSETDLVGKWTFNTVHSVGTVRMQIPSVIDTTENVDSTTTCSGGDDWVDVKADKSYQLSVNDPTMGSNAETGTWTLSGSTLTMISTGNTDTTVLTVSVSGTSGSFTRTESSTETDPTMGMTITYNVTATISATKQ